VGVDLGQSLVVQQLVELGVDGLGVDLVEY
jgi:hypothetical protein